MSGTYKKIISFLILSVLITGAFYMFKLVLNKSYVEFLFLRSPFFSLTFGIFTALFSDIDKRHNLISYDPQLYIYSWLGLLKDFAIALYMPIFLKTNKSFESKSKIFLLYTIKEWRTKHKIKSGGTLKKDNFHNRGLIRLFLKALLSSLLEKLELIFELITFILKIQFALFQNIIIILWMVFFVPPLYFVFFFTSSFSKAIISEFEEYHRNIWEREDYINQMRKIDDYSEDDIEKEIKDMEQIQNQYEKLIKKKGMEYIKKPITLNFILTSIYLFFLGVFFRVIDVI